MSLLFSVWLRTKGSVERLHLSNVSGTSLSVLLSSLAVGKSNVLYTPLLCLQISIWILLPCVYCLLLPALYVSIYQKFPSNLPIPFFWIWAIKVQWLWRFYFHLASNNRSINLLLITISQLTLYWRKDQRANLIAQLRMSTYESNTGTFRYSDKWKACYTRSMSPFT